MGNHSVGTAFAAAADVFWMALDGRPASREMALAALDAVGGRFRGVDAEFDDETAPDTPLGRMLAIAFDATPEQVADVETEEGDSPWYDGPESEFYQRYRFC